jgi:hypothetical protein
MTKLLPIIVAVVAAGGLAASACTVNSTTNNNGNSDGGEDSSTGDDGGTDTGVENDTGTPTDGGTEAAAPEANIRLANWSPDAPAAGYDFCIATHGSTTFSGPQISAATSGDAGGGLTLAFPTVTTYFGIDPGTYDIEIVAGNATDCSSPIGSAITNILPSGLAANSYYTIAFVGDSTQAGSDPTLTAIGFQDEGTPATATNANVRFLNVAPSLNGATTVDFGTGALGASSFDGLETAVAFAALATAGGDAGVTPDSNGYVSVPAFTSATEFSAHTTTGATTDTATASSQMVAEGTSATLILINGKTGQTAPSFLVCQGDSTTSATGNLSNCTQVAH